MKYQFETHLIAVSIADRYLAYLSKEQKAGPNSLVLAVTCVILAAKINEHESPLFIYVKFMVSKVYKLAITKEDYLALE